MKDLPPCPRLAGLRLGPRHAHAFQDRDAKVRHDEALRRWDTLRRAGWESPMAISSAVTA